MPASAAQAEWVSRVLGFSPGGAGDQEEHEPLLDVWQDAKDTVDSQLGALYGTLRDTGVPVLAEVADEIEGVLGDFRVALVSALIEYDRAPVESRQAARTKVLKVVSGYRLGLASDRHVIAADTNPFGVRVTIRETLGDALTQLQGRLTAGGGYAP